MVALSYLPALVLGPVLERLRKPIEKSACLGMTVCAIAYLAGQGQIMGHRRSKAVVRPPSPRILVAEIGKLVPVYSGRRGTSS
jgi:hypothetical protein